MRQYLLFYSPLSAPVCRVPLCSAFVHSIRNYPATNPPCTSSLSTSIGPPAFWLTSESPYEDRLTLACYLTKNLPAPPVPSLEILNQSACDLPALGPPPVQPLTDGTEKMLWLNNSCAAGWHRESIRHSSVTAVGELLFLGFPSKTRVCLMCEAWVDTKVSMWLKELSSFRSNWNELS